MRRLKSSADKFTFGGENWPKSGRYPMFDWLRLFLAVMVAVRIHYPFIWHFNLRQIFVWVPIWPVPTFLALSGFMALQSRERSRSVGHFWWKRFLRIFPALGASILLVWVLMGPRSVVGSIVVYLTGGNMNPGVSANGALWSLGYEEVAYALLCIGYAVALYKHQAWLWPIFALSVAYAVLPIGTRNEMNVQQLLPCFILGSLVKVNLEWLKPRLRLWHIVPLYLAALYCSVNETRVHAFSIVWLLLGCCIVFVLGLKLRVKPPIGDLSYGVYVFHMPILLALKADGVGRWQGGVFGIAFSLLAAAVSWFLIESRALRLKNWRGRNQPAAEPVPALPSGALDRLAPHPH